VLLRHVALHFGKHIQNIPAQIDFRERENTVSIRAGVLNFHCCSLSNDLWLVRTGHFV